MRDDSAQPLLAEEHSRTSLCPENVGNVAEPSVQINNGSVQRYGAINNNDDIEEADVQIVPTHGCCDKVFPNGYMHEFKALWSLALPMILTNLTEFMICVVAAIFCGHLGKTELATSALANSMINVTGLSIAVGMSSAADTLFSQIYGSPNRRKLGIALQRSLMIIPLCIFPCMALHLNAERLLLLIGQDPVTSKMTGRYLLYYFPGLLANFIDIPLAVYLQCQDIVLPSLIIGLVGNCVNAVLHYVLLFVFDFGTDGSAIAQSATCVSMMLCMITYILGSGVYKPTWTGWSKEAFLDWGRFCKMGVSGLLMDCIEWWSFEIGIYLTGFIGTTELDTQSVVFQLESIQFMIPLGIGISTSIRVGQYLGAGNAKGAITAARVAITVTYMMGITSAALYFGLRYYLPYIFTKVPEVISLVTKVIPILCIYMMCDISATCSWILKGSGRQTLGAIIAACTFSVGLSVSIPLLFKTALGIRAFWMGLAGTIIAESLVLFIIIHRTNWQKQVELAAERTGSNNIVEQEEQEGGGSGEVNSDIINVERASDTNTRSSTTTDAPSQSSDDLSHSSEELSSSPVNLPASVIRNRLILVFIMLSIFVGGLLVRLLVPVTFSIPDTQLCIPQSSHENHTDIPICQQSNFRFYQ